MTRNKEAQAAMSARKLFYLGPQGTFTHQAAVNAAQELARRTTSKGTWSPTSTP